MTNSNTPINYGEIRVDPVARMRPPYIPPILRGKLIELNIDRDVANAKFGSWEMLCLKGTTVCGRTVNPGDTFKIDGANAVMMAEHRDAEFTDKSHAKEEQEVLAKAKKLGMPQSVRELAAFAKQTGQQFSG